MAITTYDELQDAVASWAKRSDLTARVPEFIALGEAALSRGLSIRTVETDQTLSLTSSNSTVALPAGFREALNLWPEWSTGRGDPLRMVMPELLILSDVSGFPSEWCVKGSTIAFNCPADQTYTFTLRQRGSLALSDSSPTNQILTDHPDLYLAAALKEAGVFMEDADFASTWQAKYADALFDVKQALGRDKGRVTLSTEPGELGFRRHGYSIYRDS